MHISSNTYIRTHIHNIMLALLCMSNSHNWTYFFYVLGYIFKQVFALLSNRNSTSAISTNRNAITNLQWNVF